MSKEQITALFKDFDNNDLLNELLSIGEVHKIGPDEIVMRDGQYIHFIPLLLSGSIKVSKTSDLGSEMFLYFIQPGETCAITLTSTLKRESSTVIARTVEDCEILMVPANRIIFWMNKYTSWNSFILQSFRTKLTDVIRSFERIAFLKVEDQIISYLDQLAQIRNSRLVKVSHQELANDLATTRVVISRLLKKLEKQGILRRGRNKIELLG